MKLKERTTCEIKQLNKYIKKLKEQKTLQEK